MRNIDICFSRSAADVDLPSRRKRNANAILPAWMRRTGIVLAAAEGLENQVIARTLAADENTVGKWRRRFAERRLDGLHDEPRPGAPRRIGDDEIAAGTYTLKDMSSGEQKKITKADLAANERK